LTTGTKHWGQSTRGRVLPCCDELEAVVAMGKRQRRLGTAAEPAAAAPNPSGREGRRRTERGEEDEQSVARRKGRGVAGAWWALSN